MRKQTIWLTVIFVAGLACPAWAAVDLVTLPTREGTQLTIYNSEDITMVREHRLLTVKEGVNRIQFSWANTLIDQVLSRSPAGEEAACRLQRDLQAPQGGAGTEHGAEAGTIVVLFSPTIV